MTVDGEDGEELCLLLVQLVAHPVCCHQYPIAGLLLFSDVGIAPERNVAGQTKVAQLLVQWLDLPSTDALMLLNVSNVRRHAPVIGSRTQRHRQPSLPIAPTQNRSRWSVNGGTPCHLPMRIGSPGGRIFSSRRKSEPSASTHVPFATPRVGFDVIVSEGGSQRSSGLDAVAETGSYSRAKARSPLSYFGRVGPRGGEAAPSTSQLEHCPSTTGAPVLDPAMSARMPEEGGALGFALREVFESSARHSALATGATGGTLSAAELFRLAVDKLDLPHAVAHVVVSRAQREQARLRHGSADDSDVKGDADGVPADELLACPGRVSNFPAMLPSSRSAPTIDSIGSTGTGVRGGVGWSLVESGHGENTSRLGPKASSTLPAAHQCGLRVGYGAFEAVYGKHRPREADQIRLFRVLRQPGNAWVLPTDIEELVWAVASTHRGLDFLRDASEFLQARSALCRCQLVCDDRCD